MIVNANAAWMNIDIAPPVLVMICTEPVETGSVILDFISDPKRYLGSFCICYIQTL